jgi:hypothetical protein
VGLIYRTDTEKLKLTAITDKYRRSRFKTVMLLQLIEHKVNKVGKDLSTEDYSIAEKTCGNNRHPIQEDQRFENSFTTNRNLLKANVASPTFTGTVSGITATMVGY